MNVITDKKNKKIIEELLASWYDKKDIEKIIEWLNDLAKWKTHTAQEMYQKLFHKKKVYA